jgi:hypothetical protein
MSDIDSIKKAIKAQDKLRDKNVQLFTTRLRALLDKYIPKVLDFEGIELDEAASVIGGLQQGLKDAGLNKILKDFREAYGDELSLINSILSPTTTKKILSTADKEVIESLIDFDSKKVTRLIAPYVDDIGASVYRYAVAGETPDVEAILAKTGDVLESQVATEIDTLLSGFSRTVTAKKAQEFELDLFLYYGANDKITRDFCQETLEERDPPIYTIDEIKQMDNGQGLDVLTYGGGYNCRHQWIPISEQRAIELGYKV